MLQNAIPMNWYGQKLKEKAQIDEKLLKKSKKKKFTIFQRSPIHVLTGLDAAATQALNDLQKLS